MNHPATIGLTPEEVSHVIARISDVIDAAQLDAVHLELNPAPFDLHACLRRVSNLFAARAAAKHLSLGLTIDPRLPELVHADELRLSQVLINLVGNAIKFTRTGSVQVAAQLLGEDERGITLELSVRDTGIGIPESRREAIFAARTEAEACRQHAGGGGGGGDVDGAAASVGLGLAICRQLVERMGGELTMTSVVGSGSVFCFSTLLERVPHQARRPATAKLHMVPPLPPGPHGDA